MNGFTKSFHQEKGEPLSLDIKLIIMRLGLISDIITAIKTYRTEWKAFKIFIIKYFNSISQINKSCGSAELCWMTH